ncbi:LPP20 family lipoprotein [Marinomonas sp. 15G1-11]|uniref:LPP20 family lipoprotein n=1 Tax=Marinomonas phaeophyticola TaxID=3004091 RepID=A0ABT4JUT8_9GAMM|nr:LPP20 family lipoprotein [Marinomonas sp. 15G1-11]MCZ2722137.1 LPP20 family lipoprotein [Marinomonas sp. 15G1-11]
MPPSITRGTIKKRLGDIAMRFLKPMYFLCFASLFLTACNAIQNANKCTSIAPCNGNTVNNSLAENSANSSPFEIVDVIPREPIIINATGYSAPISNKKFSKSQAKLLSLRGSKLDAYRNLSERVYGLKINGTSTLSNMMTQNDELRTFVDAYLVGAKVISQRELDDGSFETVVEMALQENFRRCAGSPESIKSNPACQIRPSYQNVGSQKAQNQTNNFYSVE